MAATTATGSTDHRDDSAEPASEQAWQEKRLLAAQFTMEGLSLREAAARIGGVSHQFVRKWARRLLDMVPQEPDGHGDGNGKPGYTFKEGYQSLLQSGRPGPAPGICPKVDEILDRVKEEKDKPFRKNVGSKKIRIMAGIDASPRTIAKAVERAGFDPVSSGHSKHPARVCDPVPNGQWDIDFVEIGIDSVSGKKVLSLSVEDDHSRFSFSSDAVTEATTDHVISILEDIIRIHGKPGIVHSDHGSQWCSSNTDICRFDAWCLRNGIRHTLSPVRVPQLNGKVERYHGSLGTEAGLPETATVEEYRGRLEEYRTFYNMERPHCSLGLRTPSEVYYKTFKAFASVDILIREALDARPS